MINEGRAQSLRGKGKSAEEVFLPERKSSGNGDNISVTVTLMRVELLSIIDYGKITVFDSIP